MDPAGRDAVEFEPIWAPVIAASALTGWWLSLRPEASFRGISVTMSVLIVLMAALMCVLAIHGQHEGLASAGDWPMLAFLL